MSTDRTTAPSLGKVPEDPAAFVAEAERITNQHDVNALFAVYSDDVVVDLITDGVHERYSGLPHVIQGWRAMTAAMARRRFVVRKSVVSVGDGVVVNSWAGSIDGREGAHGLDIWHFDAAGRVRAHQLYTFLRVRPSTHPLARLQFALARPRTALTLLQEQRRIGVKPQETR